MALTPTYRPTNGDPGYYAPCYAARCDGHFVRRVNRKDGSVFYGCSNYPTCTTTRSEESIREEVAARVYGAEPNDAETWL